MANEESIEVFNSIVEGLYDAAMDPKLWPKILKNLTHYFESEAIDLLTLDHKTGLIPFSQSYNIPGDALKLYDTELVLTDPRATYVINNPEVELLFDSQYTTEK